jgi:23S rRNA-/tRNA-specific pseudouridylate synthase
MEKINRCVMILWMWFIIFQSHCQQTACFRSFINWKKVGNVGNPPRINQRLYLSKLTPNRSKSPEINHGTIRLNKCLTSLSRRAADSAILENRVTVNGRFAKPGDKVRFGDVIMLDNQKVTDWEELVEIKKQLPSSSFDEQDFLYLKYWKPVGITCTSDVSDPNNIIKYGKFCLYSQRIFTVGRLDKDSSGLILLTSDGRVNNALLNSKFNKEKVIS